MHKIFHRFRHWLHNKIYKPKHQLTARGIYLCYYIIEKYINKTRKDDFNQEYEEIVDKKLAFIESTPFFSRFKDKEGDVVEISDSVKRDFAARMVIVAMLYFCHEKDRETVYGYIKNELTLELIKGCIREGLIF